MDNLEEIEQLNVQPQLVVTEEMRSYLYDMAKWANFLAIVGFVFTGFTIISAFTVGAAIGTSPEVAAMVGAMGKLGSLGFTAIFLVYAFAIFYPSLLLFKYATKAKLGVLYGEQASLDEALGKIKSLFKYWGIVVIIFLALYMLLIVANFMRMSA